MEKLGIDFKEIPSWWEICQNAECPMAKECLRHQAFLNIPEEIMKWPCILPKALNDGHCKFFYQAMKVRMAKGFHHLINSMNSRDLRHEFRTQLTDYLGSKGAYYRHKDGERLLNPQQQMWIQDFLKSHNYGKEVVFDDYIDTYDFHFNSICPR